MDSSPGALQAAQKHLILGGPAQPISQVIFQRFADA
jgi:hypothetical protein